MDNNTTLILGDCRDVLKDIPDNSVDLIFTSPPYADRRKNTYGGIHPDTYVEWFLPIGRELLRVLKPDGTFILNIKEKAENGERHTYVEAFHRTYATIVNQFTQRFIEKFCNDGEINWELLVTFNSARPAVREQRHRYS